MPTAKVHIQCGVLTCLLLVTGVVAHAQSAKTVRDLVKKHRQCFNQCLANNLTDRIKCSQKYYYQMDSLLNMVYKGTKTNLSKNKRRQLEKEQEKWVRERDLYFAEEDKLFFEKHKSSEWRCDMEMISYEDKANFVKDRVMTLIAYSTGSQ